MDAITDAKRWAIDTSRTTFLEDYEAFYERLVTLSSPILKAGDCCDRSLVECTVEQLEVHVGDFFDQLNLSSSFIALAESPLPVTVAEITAIYDCIADLEEDERPHELLFLVLVRVMDSLNFARRHAEGLLAKVDDSLGLSDYRTPAEWRALRKTKGLSGSERTWAYLRDKHPIDILGEPSNEKKSCRLTRSLATKWGLDLPEFGISVGN